MALPEDYWSNTSSNSIVRSFIDKADQKTRDEIEQLIAGEAIVKEVRQDLTYDELDTTIDNLWSVLLMTGYLTQRGRTDGKRCCLAIPNREIRELFVYQIREWFREDSGRDTGKLNAFCESFLSGNAEAIEQHLDDYLWNTISIRDTAVRQEKQENFYHGLLLGLLGYKSNWKTKSNAESGVGYSDILIETPQRTGVVIEIKYARNLEQGCQDALAQIAEKQYDTILTDDGMKKIIRYGIAFYKKSCRVMMG
jgi:hypothetical protein